MDPIRIRISSCILVCSFLIGSVDAVEQPINSPNQERTYDMEYAFCQDVDGYPVFPPEWKRKQPEFPPQGSAVNDFSPLWIPEPAKPQNISWKDWATQLNVKVTELEAPKHGKIVITSPEWYGYSYLPRRGYLGKERAVYEIEVQDKRYKLTVNFWVMKIVTWLRGAGSENADVSTQECLRQKFQGLECLDRTKSIGFVSGDNVNVRETPHVTSRVLRTAMRGTKVKVLEKTHICFTIVGKTGQWVKVKVMDKEPIGDGWIFDSYIKYSGGSKQ